MHAAVIYYSATGNVYALAQAVVTGAEKAGAETRLRKVRELAPDEAVAANAGWQAHALEAQDVDEATLADLEWADAIIFGTPTRYGNVAAQLKQFIDTTGPLWAAGRLANKVYAGFVSTGPARRSGVDAAGTADTFYHWGGIIVPPGYVDRSSSSPATLTDQATYRPTAPTRPAKPNSRPRSSLGGAASR